jgi:magnesium-transporting ATPase (P-type)
MGGEGAGSNPWFGGDARGASDAKKATDSNRSNMSTKSFAEGAEHMTRAEFDAHIAEAREGTGPVEAYNIVGPGGILTGAGLKKAFSKDDPDAEVEKERHRHRFEKSTERIFTVNSAENLVNLAKMQEEAELGLEKGEEVHNMDVAKLAAQMDSDLAKGITSAHAAKRLEEDGPNELEKPPRVTFFVLFLIQLTQLIIVLLLGAAIASAVISATNSDRRGSALSYVDAIAIFIIVFLNAGIAASTETGANGALDALDALSAPASRVVRDGQESEVESAALVVGDLVLLNVGDVVPADCRVCESADLKVNEMLLTGESEDVSKTHVVKPKKPGQATKLTEDTMIFSSCTVKAGNCKALIVHTGMQTRVGQIAALLTDKGGGKTGPCGLPDTTSNQTPLQVALGKLAVQIGALAIGCCLIVFVVGVGVGAQDPDGASPSWLYMILISVTLTVAAIPEGLPLTVTISLSTGCAEMVKEHVLMRKIAAVETLGSCAIICTDKTGTLTEGKMRCVKMHCAGADYEVSGKGFDPTHGSIGAKDAVAGDDLAFSPDDDRKDDPNVRGMLTSALLCCSTTLAQEEDDAGELKWTPKGNSSEAPIVVAAAKIGIWAKELEPAFPRATEIPFSSSRKMMAIVTKNENGGQPPANVPDACKLDAPFVAHVKGAPNYIIEACTTMLKDGAMVPIDAAAKAKLYEVVDELSGQALRVLAISCRPLDTLPYADDDEVEDKLTAVLDGGLQFLGLVASIDPERQGVKDAIDTASHASVRTVMITGDYLKTAQAIARNISILNPDGSQDKDAVDCNDLRPGDEYLDETDMDALTGRVNVFARAKPEDKLEIVKSLQRQGWVCAMTGDGVNDAPALKEADIGVSMGLEGTEVAKGASDMILTDDNFCSIVKAVRKGRAIYAGIQKFVSFIMSVHFAEVLQIFLCVVIGLPIMREPLQILFLVLVTDLPPAIALGVEPAEPNIMDKKPRPKEQPVVMPWMWRCIVANGLVMTVGIMSTYVVALDAYAGAFMQERIKPKANWRDRNKCRVWRNNFFSYKTYKHTDNDENDDKMKECANFSIRKARTVAFIALVWAENLRAYSARSFTRPIWVNTFQNMAMNKAILGAQAALYIALFVPGLSTQVIALYPIGFKGSDGIEWYGWVLAIIGALVCLTGCELYKFYVSFNPPEGCV